MNGSVHLHFTISLLVAGKGIHFFLWLHLHFPSSFIISANCFQAVKDDVQQPLPKCQTQVDDSNLKGCLKLSSFILYTIL